MFKKVKICVSKGGGSATLQNRVSLYLNAPLPSNPIQFKDGKLYFFITSYMYVTSVRKVDLLRAI